MRLLLLNIGNTHTQFALLEYLQAPGLTALDQATLQAQWQNCILEGHCRTAELCGAMLPKADCAIGCSVVPAAWQKLQDDHPTLRELSAVTAASAAAELDLSAMDCSTLGADRIANAIALKYLYMLPAVNFDCGTAITAEIVEPPNRFVGGLIAPGRKLLYHALAAGTAQLPENTNYPLIPPAAPGHNTSEAITYGINHGVLAQVHRYREQLSQRYLSQKVSWVISGGDGDYFQNNLAEAYERAPENFTLLGVLALWLLQKSGFPGKKHGKSPAPVA